MAIIWLSENPLCIREQIPLNILRIFVNVQSKLILINLRKMQLQQQRNWQKCLPPKPLKNEDRVIKDFLYKPAVLIRHHWSTATGKSRISNKQ
jgi:hypothetical protein